MPFAGTWLLHLNQTLAPENNTPAKQSQSKTSATITTLFATLGFQSLFCPMPFPPSAALFLIPILSRSLSFFLSLSPPLPEKDKLTPAHDPYPKLFEAVPKHWQSEASFQHWQTGVR